MRAIATGKRGGAHPGFTAGFTLGTGNAWGKQTGAGSLRTRKCTAKRTPQGLQGHALIVWKQVKAKAKVSNKTKYTLHLDARRYITVLGLTIYIDHASGQYNPCWGSTAISMLRKARR